MTPMTLAVMAAQGKQLPKDAHVIIAMMKDLGITEYEPRVVHQLLEFAMRYVTCVLDDARALANHSKKKTMDSEDVKLAINMQLDKVFSSPPPRDLLLEVARAKNSTPLPAVKPHCGIRLPPDRYCFASANYRLKQLPNPPAVGKKGGKFEIYSGQGGSLKISKNSPSVTVVKRTSTISSLSKTIGTPKAPVIKYTTGAGGASIVGTVAQKIQVKPKIQVTGLQMREGSSSSTGSSQPMEVELSADSPSAKPELFDEYIGESGPFKRKREDNPDSPQLM